MVFSETSPKKNGNFTIKNKYEFRNKIRQEAINIPKFYYYLWPSRLRDLFQSPIFMSMVVGVITLVTFFRVLSADFVMWDDNISIYNNPKLGGISIERLRWIFTDVDSTMRYLPLTLLSWSITYHFWGLNPFWYHLGNWLLHGMSAALLFLTLRYLLLHGSTSRDASTTNYWWIIFSAALAALLWSLHPLRVEPVAWATDRSYCLATFFLLLSALSYLRANIAPLLPAKKKMMIAISVSFYVASLLSHPIGVGFIVVLVVLDIYPLRRLVVGRGWLRTVANRHAIFEKLPFVAAALVVSMVTLAIRLSSSGLWEKSPSLAEFGLLDRIMQSMYI